ncbi:MAG: CpaE family protein [Acidimicrobiales bacterium]
MTGQPVSDFTNFSFDDFDLGDNLDEELAEANEASDVGGGAVAVVDADQAVREYLSSLIDGRVDTGGSLAEIETRLGSAPIVIVLGPSCTSEPDLATVQRWARTRPNVGTILVTPELSTDLLRQAMRVGIRDVLSAPIDQGQLLETIARVAEDVSGALPAGTPPPPVGEAMGNGRILSVFSTKGGSGKSVTATNVGVVLAQHSDAPVALIDGHLQFGDVAVMLKLQPEYTVIDALSQLDKLDPGMLRQLMTVHEPSGLLVLPAPMEPAFADQVSGEQMVKLVEMIRSFAGHIVIDLPAIFNEVVLSLLEVSDDVLLVAGLDIPNIKNVKIGLATLEMLGVPPDKLHLVLNRADSKVKLDVAEVERTLKVAAMAHVPSDVVVPISVNKGSPVVLSASKTAVARAFEQLAMAFIERPAVTAPPPPPAPPQRRKFFG